MYSLFSALVQQQVDDLQQQRFDEKAGRSLSSINIDDINDSHPQPPGLTLSPLAQSSLGSLLSDLDDNICQPSRSASAEESSTNCYRPNHPRDSKWLNCTTPPPTAPRRYPSYEKNAEDDCDTCSMPDEAQQQQHYEMELTHVMQDDTTIIEEGVISDCNPPPALLFGGLDDSNKAVKHGWRPTLYLETSDSEENQEAEADHNLNEDLMSFSGDSSVEARILYRQQNGLCLTVASKHTSTAINGGYYGDNTDSHSYSSNFEDDDNSSYWNSPPTRETSGEGKALFAALLAAQSSALSLQENSSHQTSRPAISNNFKSEDDSSVWNEGRQQSTPDSVWKALLEKQGHVLSLKENSSHHAKMPFNSSHHKDCAVNNVVNVSDVQERKTSAYDTLWKALLESQGSTITLRGNSSHHTARSDRKNPPLCSREASTPMAALKEAIPDIWAKEVMHPRQLGQSINSSMAPLNIKTSNGDDTQSVWGDMLENEKFKVSLRDISAPTSETLELAQNSLSNDNQCAGESQIGVIKKHVTPTRGRQYNPAGPLSTYMAQMEAFVPNTAKIHTASRLQESEPSASKVVAVQQRRAPQSLLSKGTLDEPAEVPSTSRLITTCTPRSPMSTNAYRSINRDVKCCVTSPHQQQHEQASDEERALTKPGAYSIRQVSTDGEDNDGETTCSYGVTSEASIAGRSVISAPWALVLPSRTVSITPVPLVEAHPDQEEGISTSNDATDEVVRRNKDRNSARCSLSRARKVFTRIFRPFTS